VFPDYTKVTMPLHFDPDDGAWIQEMLGRVRASTRAKITAKYSEVYFVEWENEPVSFRKSNAARQAANIQLREFVTKYERAAQGYTAQPLRVVNQ
jgi:hypothetical protein